MRKQVYNSNNNTRSTFDREYDNLMRDIRRERREIKSCMLREKKNSNLIQTLVRGELFRLK